MSSNFAIQGEAVSNSSLVAAYSNDAALSSYSFIGTTFKIITLKIASYLTDPICKVREYFYTFYILNVICEGTVQKVIKVVFLTLGIALFTLLTPLTAPFGAVLRGLVSTLESKAFIFIKKAQVGKTLPPDNKITIVSHNECLMPAGYSITDGQVTPPSDKERIKANIRELKRLNPDIICLFEVPDICDASYIASQLPEYPFVIPVAGVRAIGPSSMIYVASKYEIVEDSIEFVPFIKGTELTGRAQFSEKGFLSFDIKSQNQSTVIATHLQHSEIPANPEPGDKTSRAAQMNKIMRKIQKMVNLGRNVIFTGDLNQDEAELNAFLARYPANLLRRDISVQGIPTWGGDKWCADLMKKPSSGSSVLDYTFIAGKAISISTQIIGSNYSGFEVRRNAPTDHNMLVSTIIVG